MSKSINNDLFTRGKVIEAINTLIASERGKKEQNNLKKLRNRVESETKTVFSRNDIWVIINRSHFISEKRAEHLNSALLLLL